MFFYALLAVVAALFLWKAVPVVWESMMSGWRPRAALSFLVGWYVIVRLAARTNRFRTLANRWQSSGLLYGLCFNLLFFGLPLGVFAYLAPLHHRGEMLVWIVAMSVLISIVAWFPTRKVHSDTPQ